LVGRSKQTSCLREAVAFDEPVPQDLPGGVTDTVWTQRYACRAEFLYFRGGEAVEAARREGRNVYKVRIRTSVEARAIRHAWRMRDTRRGVDYNIVEIDSISDPAWVYLVVQTGKAA
jgi:hypothetical protein